MNNLKRLFYIVAISATLVAPATAHDISMVKMNIKGPIKSNNIFLCVSDMGCFSLFTAQNGKPFPINPGKIRSLISTDINTYRMYPYALPTSCAIDLPAKKTLIITGKLHINASSIRIADLSCKVA